MLLYAKEFKELLGQELEGFRLYIDESSLEKSFLFDVLLFEEEFGEITNFSGAKLDLLLSICELY